MMNHKDQTRKDYCLIMRNAVYSLELKCIESLQVNVQHHLNQDSLYITRRRSQSAEDAMKLLGRAGFCGFATCTYGPIIYSRTHDDVFDGRVNIYF